MDGKEFDINNLPDDIVKKPFDIKANLMSDLTPPINNVGLGREAFNDISKNVKAKEKREKENNKAIKDINKLISTMEESNKGNEKLSKRMFWLTVATVLLAIVQIAIAVIAIFK